MRKFANKKRQASKSSSNNKSSKNKTRKPEKKNKNRKPGKDETEKNRKAQKPGKPEKKRVYYLFLRYLILILAALPNLWLFYFIFTPLTLYPVLFLLKLFFHVSLSNTTIILEGFPIYLVKACIAGSAYYLLLTLNLTTPMQAKKRALSLIFSFTAFLLINILRIFIFSVLFIKAFSLFNLTHLIFWYFLSGIIVFLVWIATIKTFRIKEIPAYSDLKFLYRKIKAR